MTSERAVTKTFRLSDRFAVEITVGPQGWTTEWLPDIPDSLTRKERRAYLRARREMLARLSGMVGGSVAVFDLDSSGNLSLGDAVENE